ncbi:hypothetical protein NIES2101_08230 [Calothrix sp. HK-06]|nr:hypothetical protein NIES2101_08230 [Calothrix sp. HK-06]
MVNGIAEFSLTDLLVMKSLSYKLFRQKLMNKLLGIEMYRPLLKVSTALFINVHKCLQILMLISYLSY